MTALPKSSLRQLSLVLSCLLFVCFITPGGAYAGVTCIDTSKGQGCIITDEDGNIWTTVTYKEHPPADYSSCIPAAIALLPSSYTLLNESGVSISLVIGASTMTIDSGDSVSWPFALSQFSLDASSLPPMSPGGNNFVKLFSYYPGSVGLEEVYQFSSSAIGIPDELSWQAYAIDAVTNTRTEDLMTALTGSSYVPIIDTVGSLTVDLHLCAGKADLDFDGTVDIHDIDVLVSAIAEEVFTDFYDLNGDTLLDAGDITEWLALAGSQLLPSGNSFIMGDANLDGVVDTSDFNVWNANKFTDTLLWSDGNFNGDAGVDVSDFNIWNTTKFTASDTVSVPEPDAAKNMLAWFAMIGWLFIAERR